MSEADREEFVASTNHFLNNPDCGIIDPFVLGVHEIATGKRHGVVAPSSRARSEARRRRRHDDESSDDDEKDDTYDALVDGGHTTESHFHIGKLLFLRHGVHMKLSEHHSSVVDHVSMASQALLKSYGLVEEKRLRCSAHSNRKKMDPRSLKFMRHITDDLCFCNNWLQRTAAIIKLF